MVHVGDETDDSTEQQTGDATVERPSPTISRRSYLTVAGTTAASLAIGVGTATARELHGVTFEQVLDAVDDVGCDPNGDSACQDQIASAAADNTLIEFPAGTYRIDNELLVLGRRNFGLVGAGDVTFEIPADTRIWAVNLADMTNAVFANIDIDQTAENALGRTRFGASGGHFHVGDVTVEGPAEANRNGKAQILPFSRDPGGTVTVENFTAADGGVPGTYTEGGGGVYVGGANRGTVRLLDCHFEGFPDNGAYCSRTPGTVQIEGGLYKNNDISQIRLSGDSYAENVTAVADHNDWGEGKLGDPANANGTRLVWWEPRNGTAGEVRNSTLRAIRWDGDFLNVFSGADRDAIDVNNEIIQE